METWCGAPLPAQVRLRDAVAGTIHINMFGRSNLLIDHFLLLFFSLRVSSRSLTNKTTRLGSWNAILIKEELGAKYGHC